MLVELTEANTDDTLVFAEVLADSRLRIANYTTEFPRLRRPLMPSSQKSPLRSHWKLCAAEANCCSL